MFLIFKTRSGLDQPTTSAMLLSVMAVVIVLSLGHGCEGKLFKIVDKHGQTRSLLNVTATITVTAFENGIQGSNVTVDQDSKDVKLEPGTDDPDVGGMYLLFPHKIEWMFVLLFADTTPRLQLSVWFIPQYVFGDLTNSTKLYRFTNPEKPALGKGDDASYQCSIPDSRYYRYGAFVSSGPDDGSPDLSSDSGDGLTYTVQVSVDSIQVQVTGVQDDQFGPAVHCGDPVPTVHPIPPGNSSGWNTVDLALVIALGTIGAVCLLVIIVCIPRLYCHRRQGIKRQRIY